MIEDRYKAIPETGSYKNMVTGEILSPKFEYDYYKVLYLLNEHAELKQINTELVESLDEEINSFNDSYSGLKKKYIELEKKNQRFKVELLGAIECERTNLARNAMINLAVNLGVEL